MKLTEPQRDELRYALEDGGMPEVLAYMAAQRAKRPLDGYHGIALYFIWDETPEGDDFWSAVYACQRECMK